MRIIEDIDNTNYAEELQEFPHRCVCGRLLGIEYSDLFLKEVERLSPKNETYMTSVERATCPGCSALTDVSYSLKTACENQKIPYDKLKRTIVQGGPQKLRTF